MNKILRAHIAVIIVNLIYGGNFHIAKLLMPRYIQPFGFIILRVVVSVVLFFLVAPFFGKEKISKKDFPLLALCGLFGVAINQMLFFKGLSLTFPINGAIIMTSNPIFVLIIAAILIRERITLRKTLGIILGCAGALSLLLAGREVSFRSSTFLGDVCIFINAISYGIFLVISKPLLKKYKPITVIKWTFVFGTLVVLPFGWSEVRIIPWAEFTPALWWCIGYVVIATTFFAYLLNTIALDTLSPSIVSFYIYLQPILVTIMSLFLGNDRPTFQHFVSALLIFTGVYLVSVSPQQTNNLRA